MAQANATLSQMGYVPACLHGYHQKAILQKQVAVSTLHCPRAGNQVSRERERRVVSLRFGWYLLKVPHFVSYAALYCGVLVCVERGSPQKQ